jgi:hypothetical protein
MNDPRVVFLLINPTLAQVPHRQSSTSLLQLLAMIPLKVTWKMHGLSSRFVVILAYFTPHPDFVPQPYLEAQTESIVYAIQNVLSGVRSPTPSPALNENITQIITIISIILRRQRTGSFSATRQRNRELSEHTNRLSDVQALPEVTNEAMTSRSVSYGLYYCAGWNSAVELYIIQVVNGCQ